VADVNFQQWRWQRGGALLLASAWALQACQHTPPQPGSGPTPRPGPAAPASPRAPADPERDGPEANPPADLLLVPDAEPRVEPLRTGGPNKPYEVLGERYTPLQGDAPLRERGLASWYGRKFHGRGTATGELYNMYAMTAAHRTMPLPSYARVRNPANGREVIVRVNDRGPFHSTRVIDLSYTAALKLGLLGGVAPVEVERITHEAIRAGSWRMPGDGQAVATLAEPAGPAGDDPIAELANRRAARPGPALPALPPVPAPGQPLPAGAGTAGGASKAAPGFWLQLGAFRAHDGAVGFQWQVVQQAAWLAPLLAIFNERGLHRLQAGPYAARDEAQAAAQRLRELMALQATVVERR